MIIIIVLPLFILSVDYNTGLSNQTRSPAMFATLESIPAWMLVWWNAWLSIYIQYNPGQQCLLSSNKQKLPNDYPAVYGLVDISYVPQLKPLCWALMRCTEPRIDQCDLIRGQIRKYILRTSARRYSESSISLLILSCASLTWHRPICNRKCSEHDDLKLQGTFMHAHSWWYIHMERRAKVSELLAMLFEIVLKLAERMTAQLAADGRRVWKEASKLIVFHVPKQIIAFSNLIQATRLLLTSSYVWQIILLFWAACWENMSRVIHF